jgi:hypothetical protein
MKNTVFYVVTQCSSEKGRCFGETYRLHLQDRRISQINTRVSRRQDEPACILLGLLFDPEDGYDIYILVSWGGVRLSPLGTSATNWPIAPAPDDDECGAVGGMRLDRGS